MFRIFELDGKLIVHLSPPDRVLKSKGMLSSA